MRWIPFVAVLALGCSDKSTTGTGECSGNDDCEAGHVCYEGSCAVLCSTDADCGPNDCDGGTICQGDVCQPGCRTEVPTILTIDGNGTVDSESTHADHHFADALVITGENIEGASVQLSGDQSWNLSASAGSSGSEIVALLPTDLVPGDYLVRVFNDVGADQGTVTILQGEQGPAGPTGPLPNVLTGGGMTGDGSTGSPLQLDDAYLDARYAPVGNYMAGDAPVLPNVTTAERDAISSPQAGRLVFNTETGKVNVYDGSGWGALGGGWRLVRTNTELQGDITIHAVTPLWDFPISDLPDNTRAVIIGLKYFHGGTGSDHGYLSFWAYQHGRDADTEYAAYFENIHYADYYNSDYFELIVPWEESLQDTLRVQVMSSYNDSSLNIYDISLKGYIVAD